MSKELKAVRMVSGTRNVKEISIVVPDHVYDLLSPYNIDVIDHKLTVDTCSIYLMKDKEDKYSITFNPHDKNAYAEAIKKLIKQMELEKK